MRKNLLSLKYKNRAQVTLFVIIAIIIAAAIAGYFYYRSLPQKEVISKDPAENFFLTCAENALADGARILGEQGGYISLPKFEQGSPFMPTSSQLDFLGSPVQYWYYISGNNIQREKVPTIESMQKQLEDYVSTQVKYCDFSSYELQGYVFETSDSAKATVKILDNQITASIDYPITIKYADTTARFETHKIQISSSTGKFYKTAKKIYDSEQSSLFLENYTLDVLSLYAPTSGVDISCSPKVWLKQGIINDVKDALEGNVQALKVQGNYYTSTGENKYFIIKSVSSSDSVNFLYSKQWPARFETYPSDEVIVAKPVGLQPGMGALGFCYIQYHFVYDLAFPVLVQVYNQKELFQFPVLVVIKNNMARNSSISEPEGIADTMCDRKNTDVSVKVQDSSGRNVDAQISFKCFNQICDIGRTSSGTLSDVFPQCVNGFLIASEEGYVDGKMQLDTNEPASAVIFMKKLYDLNLNLALSGAPLSSKDNAIITFASPEYTATASYPQQKRIQLAEGFYNVSVYVYRDGNINLGAYTTKECVKVPASGILGIFGVEQEKCFEINMPAQNLNTTLGGGGNAIIDISEQDLRTASTVRISAPYFKTPSTLQDLQDNYELVDSSSVEVTIQ